MLKYLFFLPISIFLMQCENDATEDCSATTCTANTLKLIIVDSTTGENLIENGSYTDADISIFDEKNMASLFYVNTTESVPGIQLQVAITESQEKSYTVSLKSDASFSTTMDVKKIGEGSECCGVDTQINSISVSGATSEINLSNRSLTIFID